MPTIGKLTVYTVTEVAELFGTSPRTVRAWLCDGTFEGRKLGGRWYVRSLTVEN